MRLTVRQYLQRLGNSVPPAATIGISVIVATIILSVTAVRSNAKADTATDKAVTIAGSLSVLCHAGNDLASLLQSARTTDGKPLCPVAEEIKTNPTAAPVQLVSDDHIVSLIREQLAKQLPQTATPQAPTLEQVTAAVRSLMVSDPILFKGDKGDPPSQAEVAQVVAGYFRTNAAQFRGEQGPPGPPGKDGASGRDGTNGQNGQDGGYTSPPTVTETAPPTSEPEPTDSPPATDTQTEQQSSSNGVLGNLLGGRSNQRPAHGR